MSARAEAGAAAVAGLNHRPEDGGHGRFHTKSVERSIEETDEPEHKLKKELAKLVSTPVKADA